MREPRNRQRLQPDPPRASQRGHEDSIAAEEHVANSGNRGDLKRHAGLEGAHMARMNAQRLPGAKVLSDDLARQLNPRGADTADMLQPKAIAAKDTRAQRVLESHPQLHLRRGAKKAVTMDKVLVSVDHRHGQNMPRNLGGKGKFAGISQGAILSHE